MNAVGNLSEGEDKDPPLKPPLITERPMVALAPLSSLTAQIPPTSQTSQASPAQEAGFASLPPLETKVDPLNSLNRLRAKVSYTRETPAASISNQSTLARVQSTPAVAAAGPHAAATLSSSDISEQDDELIAAAALQSLGAKESLVPYGPPKKTFLNKMQASPLVSGAVRAYNSGKSNSPLFKYSAEKLERAIVESSGRISKSHKLGSRLLARRASNHLKKVFKAESWGRGTQESVKRLRYCVHMLKLASNRLAQNVAKLQETVQKQHQEKMRAAALTIDKQQSQFQLTVLALRKDIAQTVRRAVTVVSTVAGNSLPEPARTHVRNYIMRLPAKWMATIKHEATDNDDEIGGRTISLAKESLDMFRNIISIVDQMIGSSKRGEDDEFDVDDNETEDDTSSIEQTSNNAATPDT